MPKEIKGPAYFNCLSAVAIIAYVFRRAVDLQFLATILSILFFEEVFLLLWDRLESNEQATLYKRSKEVLHSFSRASYFLDYGRFCSDQQAQKEDLDMEGRKELLTMKQNIEGHILKKYLPQIPVFIAFCFNLFSIWNTIGLCVGHCDAWDVQCYALCLIPRFMSIGFQFYFLGTYNSVFLEKHWA